MSNLKLVINNSNKEQNQRYFFEKKELKIILDLYAKMVSEGSWKDYGLSISSKRVSFSIFKNAAEKAIYNICKNFKPSIVSCGNDLYQLRIFDIWSDRYIYFSVVLP